MTPHIPTTPFGRRPLSLAHVAANANARAATGSKPAHKWQVFRDICEARRMLGVSERTLAVLDALLSFHPETVLTGEGLIVFPSNRQLMLRTHGMAETTLRRHLAALADAGLLVRRDSPNGKRYARRVDGAVERAFGFDIAPMVTRAEEFAALAEEVRAGERALRLARERISLCRRDIIKMIATGIGEGVPADWAGIHAGFRAIIEGISRNPLLDELEAAAATLGDLADDIAKLLEDHVNLQKMTGNASQTERHKQNSNPEPPADLEPRLPSDEAASVKPMIETPKREYVFPLGMILDACPDLADYARGGILNWRDFLATVAVVRPMLGISPSAWEAGVDAMGEANASIVVACILQRGSAIMSAGGYMRDLTRRAGEGSFSVGPMIMALLSAKRRTEKLKA